MPRRTNTLRQDHVEERTAHAPTLGSRICNRCLAAQSLCNAGLGEGLGFWIGGNRVAETLHPFLWGLGVGFRVEGLGFRV